MVSIEASIVEKVSADAMHGGGLAGCPHVDVGVELRIRDRGNERVARAGACVAFEPPHRCTGMRW